MTWIEYHSKSEEHASLAQAALRDGDAKRALEMCRLAALEETQAVGCVDPAKQRTFGITAVSAASLWFKAQDYAEAERVALNWMNSAQLPSFALDQIRLILQTVMKLWVRITLQRHLLLDY